MTAFKSAVTIILGTIAAVIACVVNAAFLYFGFAVIVWFSAHAIGYLLIGATIALLICTVVLLPLAVFRKTRMASAYGLLCSSFLFGLCTLIAGLMTTLQYWGVFGVAFGLFTGVVSLVPLGMLAAAVHADWEAFVLLAVGLVLTFGAGLIAMAMMASHEKRPAVPSHPIGTPCGAQIPIRGQIRKAWH
jgi:hypothetical protein